MTVPTLVWCDSFEHGQPGLNNAQGPFAGGSGTPAIVTTPVRTGARALEISAVGAAEERQYQGSGSTTAWTGVYIRFASLPSADCTLAYIQVSGQQSGRLKFNNTTDTFQIQVGAGTAVDVGAALSTGVWYRVLFELDTSTDTATMRCVVGADNAANSTEQTATVAQTSAGTTQHGLGTDTAGTFTAYYDDWILGGVDGDYELLRDAPDPDWTVVRLSPSRDGAHSTGAAGSYTDGSVNITDATTDAWTRLDDVPLNNSNTAGETIRQILTGGYVEIGFDTLPAGTDEPADMVFMGLHVDAAASGAGNSIVSMHTAAGTTLNTVLSGDPGTTVVAKTTKVTRPVGGWTRALVNGVLARWGQGDGAPDSHLLNMMLQVALFPPFVAERTASVGAAGDVSASGTVIPGITSHERSAAVDAAGSVSTEFVPYQVTGLTTTFISATQIDLEWDELIYQGAGYVYDIERDGVVIVRDHPTTSYSDIGLTASTEYDYRVRAVR